MQGEEQKAYLPKLDIEGDNWVMYQDHLIWIMKQSSIKDHIANDSPPAAYLVKGKIGGLESQERWEHEEHTICMALGNSMPDDAFAQIKDTDSVKDTWDVLKSMYKDHTAMLVADRMKVFQDIKCPEGGNIHSHFWQLANLWDQLASLGQMITDQDYLDTLLASLP